MYMYSISVYTGGLWEREWNRDSHSGKQDQWNGIQTVLQPALGVKVQVEDHSSDDVGQEREKEKIANETLLIVDIPLLAFRDLLQVLGREGGREGGRERERERER